MQSQTWHELMVIGSALLVCGFWAASMIMPF